MSLKKGENDRKSGVRKICFKIKATDDKTGLVGSSACGIRQDFKKLSQHHRRELFLGAS